MGQNKRLSKNKIKVIAEISTLAAAGTLSAAARMIPGFAQWYSTHLYPIWVGSIGRILGYFPFSVSELLLYLLIFWVCTVFIRLIARKAISKRKAVETGCYLAIALCFLYVVNCGVNYQRDSFSETSGILMEEYTSEELEEVCRWLTENIADYSDKVKRGSDGGMILKVSVGRAAVEAMEKLSDEYPELKGYYPKPKKLVNSWILSIQNLSGVYSPFTIEANYNGDMQDYYIPFTACHELSHLRGFMQEQEANFISFLACINSGENEFVYSGNLSGWIQCMNVLYRVDYDAWEEVRNQLPSEVEADLKLNREFWAKYDGRIAEVSNRVNDTYLKANGQKDGVESYNRMVDLIVAYYKYQYIQNGCQ